MGMVAPEQRIASAFFVLNGKYGDVTRYAQERGVCRQWIYREAAALSSRIGREPDVQAESLRRLALVRRRDGRMAEAASAWQDLVNTPGCSSTFRREAREALAIHHEHRSRDLQTARAYVLDVLAEDTAERRREQAHYRLRRIERKIALRRLTSAEQGGLFLAGLLG